MSAWRRMYARANRTAARNHREHERQRRAEIHAGPAGTLHHGGRTALLFTGTETKISVAGEVVMAYRSPDFVLIPEQYAQIITATPAPLSDHMRPKARRGR